MEATSQTKLRLRLAPKHRFAQFLQLSYWFAILVCFPLAVAPSLAGGTVSSERWILLPKAFVLVVTLGLGLLAILATYRESNLADAGRAIVKLPTLLKLVTLLVPLTLVIGLLQSDNLAVAAIGSAARVDGALVQAAWLSLAIISYSLAIRPAISTRWVLGLFVTGTTLVGVWAGLQVIFIEPLAFLGFHQVPSGRPIASLGHRAMVTCLVAMGLASVVTWAGLRGRPLLAFVPLSFLLAGLLVATEGRAGFIGFVVVWLFLFSYLLVTRRTLTAFIVISVSVLLGGGLVAATKSNGVRQVVTIAAASQGEDGSFKARYAYYWPIAIEAIGQRPVFGWGIEGFSSAFWSISTAEEQYWIVRNHLSRSDYPIVRVTGTPVQFFKTSEASPEKVTFFTVDRAHNMYLDTAVSFGIPYALIFISVLSLWGVAVIRSNAALTLALGASGVAYLVFSTAWFAVLQLTPIFWVLVGVTTALVHSRRKTIID